MSAGRAWTEEQHTAIARREGALLVDAAAGSGKTSVLVERFVCGVLEDGLEVGSLLAITFTEKAAAELRDRIRARLRELGAREAASETEGAWIATIHGFCARVLRASALAAGLDPAFTVLDSDQAEPLADAAFDAALSALAAGDPRTVTLVADYGAAALRATIRSVHAQLRSRGERHPRLPPAPPAPGPQTLGLLHTAARALAGELGAVPDPGRRVEQALDRVQACLALEAGDTWPGDLDALTLPANGATLGTDACEAYREALAAYRDACATRAGSPVRDLMDRLLNGFGRHYEAAKRERSAVDFSDLELLTRDLLRDDAELRAQYAERFTRIMVDEQQDTNRVQQELIESIAGENLFTVGDAQQSIYRFRHADVALFEERGAALAREGRRLTLDTNFRSRAEILSAINAAFAEELGERFRPLRPGRVSSEPPGGDPRVELLLVDKGAEWDLEGLAAPWRLAEARALARHVRTLVDRGAPAGDVVVLMRATTDMRAYERALEREGLATYVIGGRGYWGHPQVLDLIAYLRVLANPRDDEALHTVLASPLVGASLDALVVLAGTARERDQDPWRVLIDSRGELDGLGAADREALATAAAWIAAERVRAQRGGIDGLIDRALALTGYDVAMLALPGGRRRLANVRKLMRLGREWEAEHGPDLRGFLHLAAERAAGRAGASREAEAPIEGEGLDAVRVMTIHRAKGLEFPVVCVADLGRSVRPPFDLIRVSGDGRLGLRLGRSGAGERVSAFAFDELGREEKAAEEAEERRLFYVAVTRAQERLVLSGATRFQGWVEGGNKGGGSVSWLAPAFVPELATRIAEGGGDVTLGETTVRLILAGDPQAGAGAAPSSVPAPTSVPAPPSVPGPASVPAPAAPAIEPASAEPAPPADLPAGPAAPVVDRLSYSALGAYARCGYRFYAERVLGLPSGADGPAADDLVADDPEPGEPVVAAAPSGRGATERGTVLHALLEGLDFRRPVAPVAATVAAAAHRAGLELEPTAEESEALIALVAGFARSDLCRRLGRATAPPRREERFAYALGPGVLMTGAVDVLAREPAGRLLIVDYKSDRLNSRTPAAVTDAAYATQRAIYALAGLHAGAEAVEVVHCFLEAPDEPASTTFTRADLDELDASVLRLAQGPMRGPYTVTDVPHRGICAGCPAEGGLCAWPLGMTQRLAPDRLF